MLSECQMKKGEPVLSIILGKDGAIKPSVRGAMMEMKNEKEHNYSAIDKVICEIMRLTANEILAEYKAAGLPLPDADDLFRQIRKRIKAGAMKVR